jgi:ABC-type dipeptide/oligopeptide/nickel transport system permease component
VKTLASFIVSLILSFFLSYFLVVILPGTFESDEVQLVSNEQRNLDLDLSFVLKNYLTGDWGKSWLAPDESVARIIFESAKMTLGLQVMAVLLIILLSLYLSYRSVRNEKFAKVLTPFLRTLASLPLLLWLPISLWVTSFWLGWMPFRYDETWISWVLPLLGLSLKPLAVSTLLLIERWKKSLKEDYIKAARAKGLRFQHILFRHGLRNSLMVYVTHLIQVMAQLLTGSVLIESLFSWPGIGTLFIDGLKQRDTPVLLGVVFVLIFITLSVQLFLRSIHKRLDPRLMT